MNREEMLKNLRNSVSSKLSEKRYIHTLGVEKMSVMLSELCLPEKKFELSAAALLHDITKEESVQFQQQIFSLENAKDEEADVFDNAVLHSFTAPYIIKRDYPLFATEEILSAVEKHTVGDEDMSIFDEIIFLADFIEEGRKYQDSVLIRKYVFDNMKLGNISENLCVLHRACIMEIDSTLSHLESIGKQAARRSLLAKASLLSKI